MQCHTLALAALGSTNAMKQNLRTMPSSLTPLFPGAKRTAHPVRCFVACLLLGLGYAHGALAALYESNPANFGTQLTSPSDCDDCFSGPFAFGGGHTLNFFGTTYSDLYVSSNGYVTFGAGASQYTPVALDVQVVAPMIAALFTDLDSSSDPASAVYVNTATPGQIVVTWSGMGHYDRNYAVLSTFQLVIRSSQFGVPPGEGRIGFFYGNVTDGATAVAGFGDGLVAVNPGETVFLNGPGTGLHQSAPRWYHLNGGVPVAPGAGPVAVPTLGESALVLLAGVLGLFSLGALRRRGDSKR